jgi:glyoxylase-like metal-dependent hydrolase (beta-lactamase superfamily II)
MRKVTDNVYLIKPGVLIKDDHDNIRYMSSSVILMHDEFPILVDTGLRSDWKTIKKGIEEAGFSVEDVKLIINTHLHPDHTGCNEMIDAPRYSTDDNPRSKISKNVWIMETPGHCYDDISVVFEDEKVVVAAGDAIPTKGNFLRWVPPRINVDRETAIRSMEAIERIADVIIPGHDEPFLLDRTRKS